MLGYSRLFTPAIAKLNNISSVPSQISYKHTYKGNPITSERLHGIKKTHFSSFLYNQYLTEDTPKNYEQTQHPKHSSNPNESNTSFSSQEDNEFLELIKNKYNIDFITLSLNDTQKFVDGYKPLSIIGEGTFGLVIKAIKLTGEKDAVEAIKIIDKNRIKSVSTVINEYNILKSLNNPFITKVYDIIETHRYVFISMEYIPGGTLKELIIKRYLNRNSKNLFTLHEISLFIKYLGLSIETCHKSCIIHRDIKPENILLRDSTDMSSVVLCDFGSACGNSTTNISHDIKGIYGTLIYMAPEILNRTSSYNQGVDIYSCGIILSILISGGKHPIYRKGEGKDEFRKRVCKNKKWFLDICDINKNIKNSHNDYWLAWNLVSHLCKYEVNERYDYKLASKHPFISPSNIDIPMKTNVKSRLLNKIKEFKSLLQIGIVLKYIKHAIEDNSIKSNKSLKTIKFKKKTYSGLTLPNINLFQRKNIKQSLNGLNEKLNQITKRSYSNSQAKKDVVCKSNIVSKSMIKAGKIINGKKYGCILSLKRIVINV